MKSLMIQLSKALVALAVLNLSGQAQSKPAWQTHLDWSIQNLDAGGSVDCPDKYVEAYPECLVSGGRSCMMKKAIQSAKDNDCSNALRVSQITQCHNVTARDQIRDAGQNAVCRYLKTK